MSLPVVLPGSCCPVSGALQLPEPSLRGRAAGSRPPPPGRPLLSLGLLQLLLGGSMVALSFGALSLSSSAPVRNSCPFWAGSSVLLSGLVGVATWRKPLLILVNMFVLLSVVCVLINLAGFILCCQGAQLVSSLSYCQLSEAGDVCYCCSVSPASKCSEEKLLALHPGQSCSTMRNLLKKLLFALCALNALTTAVCLMAAALRYLQIFTARAPCMDESRTQEEPPQVPDPDHFVAPPPPPSYFSTFYSYTPRLACRMGGGGGVPLPHIYGARIKGVEVFCPLDPPPPYEVIAGSSTPPAAQEMELTSYPSRTLLRTVEDLQVASGSAGATPQVASGSAGATPQVSGSAGAAPQVSGSAGAAPQVSGSAGAAPQVSGSAGAAPQVSGSAGAAPQVSGSAGAAPQVSGSAGAAPQVSGSAGAAPQVSGSAGAAPQVSGSAGAAPQVNQPPRQQQLAMVAASWSRQRICRSHSDPVLIDLAAKVWNCSSLSAAPPAAAAPPPAAAPAAAPPPAAPPPPPAPAPLQRIDSSTQTSQPTLASQALDQVTLRWSRNGSSTGTRSRRQARPTSMVDYQSYQHTQHLVKKILEQPAARGLAPEVQELVDSIRKVLQSDQEHMEEAVRCASYIEQVFGDSDVTSSPSRPEQPSRRFHLLPGTPRRRAGLLHLQSCGDLSSYTCSTLQPLHHPAGSRRRGLRAGSRAGSRLEHPERAHSLIGVVRETVL